MKAIKSERKLVLEARNIHLVSATRKQKTWMLNTLMANVLECFDGKC